MYVSGRDLVPPFQVEAYQSAKDAGWLVGLMLAIVVVAPIGEEIAFRGFLYRGLVRPGYERAGHCRHFAGLGVAAHPVRLARHGADLRGGP